MGEAALAHPPSGQRQRGGRVQVARQFADRTRPRLVAEGEGAEGQLRRRPAAKARDLGADTFMVKPFAPDDLKRLIDTLYTRFNCARIQWPA